jgi:formylglycine-generating enzyme required for sulfatase activity/serine/threonine protein phosphatase PrpC
MSFTFDIYGSQIDGARDLQEDAYMSTHIGDLGKDGEGGASLVVVADGMGGHAAGNVASNMAVQAFNKHVSRNYPNENLSEILYQSVIQGNNFIAKTVQDTSALQGMGCTLVAAIFEGKYVRWASVGDSHLYLIRDKQFFKKNADHSYGGFLARMAAAGTPMEPEPGFSRNMLMSALTGDEIAEIDCPLVPMELRAGDRLIFATDGLDTLSHGTILYQSDGATTARECAEALLTAVEDAHKSRQDNTTVVVVDVRSKEGSAGALQPGAALAAVPAAPEEPDDAVPLTQLAAAEAAVPIAPPADAASLTIPETPATRRQDAAQEAVGVPPAPPAAVAPPPPLADAADRKKKQWITIAAAVLGALLVAGIAAYLMGGRAPATPPTPPPEVVQPAVPEGTEPPPTPEAPAKSAAAETPAPGPQAAPVATPPAAAPPPTAPPFRDALKSGGQGPEMVWLAAGSYTMGASAQSTEYNERPGHDVTVKRFAIGTAEITVAEYEAFATAAGRKISAKALDVADKGSYAMRYVSWADALEYTKWLSKETGHRYRIPSEAEWEYAAHGGTTTSYWWGREPGTNQAHCMGCGSQFDPRNPTKVKSFPPNPYGLFDTAGNLSEWVYDCWHKNYDGAPDDGGVFEGGDCGVRASRGGSYANTPASIRPTKRDKALSTRPSDEIGLRIVRDE